MVQSARVDATTASRIGEGESRRTSLGQGCAAGLLLLLLVAVASRAQDSPPAASPKVRLTAGDAQSLVREVSATVEQLRRLRFKTPVAVELVDSAAARMAFASEVSEAERERTRHKADAWAHLGLVPAATDLVEAGLDTVEKDVQGYYESGSKRFHLLDHVALHEVRAVMAHELTHALEDQHYDLLAFQRRARNEDHAVALRAVVEGSAMVTTLAMLQRQSGIGKAREEAARRSEARASTVKGKPSFVQAQLMLPYTLGFSFLLRGKPWEWLYDGVRMEDVERAYAEPPDSTREVLHPEQYWAGRRRESQRLELGDLSPQLGPGWSLALVGSIGELGLTHITRSASEQGGFHALLPTRWTTRGASGNEAELYHHYVNGDRKVTVLLTRWESALDADQFQAALRLPRGVSKAVVRVGVNIVVLLGDYGDKVSVLAGEATRGLGFWSAP